MTASQQAALVSYIKKRANDWGWNAHPELYGARSHQRGAHKWGLQHRGMGLLHMTLYCSTTWPRHELNANWIRCIHNGTGLHVSWYTVERSEPDLLRLFLNFCHHATVPAADIKTLEQSTFLILVNYSHNYRVITLATRRRLVSKKMHKKKLRVVMPPPNSRTKHCDVIDFNGVCWVLRNT